MIPRATGLLAALAIAGSSATLIAQDLRRSGDSPADSAAIFAERMVALGDADSDKRLSRDEFLALADRWFDTLDTARAGTVSQEEFVLGFRKLELRSDRLSPAAGPADARRYVGLFVTLDADRSATLSRDEVRRTFARWYDAWDPAGRGGLDQHHLTTGLGGVLPPTNMGASGPGGTQQRIAGLPDQPPSPVLEPDAARRAIHVAEGLRVELAASEPMVQDPVAIAFDPDGRLFVLEMRGFMLDIHGTREREPTGRLSLLEDTDGDGRFDQSSVYLDGLVVPRSVSAMRGGVLFVSDYQLHYAGDTDGDGRADRVELVDPDYGAGNIEHAPNGLMPALDNWIYSAKSAFRYRWFGRTLVKQPTEYRGQWGITQDNVGRLFYNVNNSQLLGDYTPPNYMSRNPHHPSSAGLNLFVATDQRIFTRRMNTAVNRGYLPDVIDPRTGRLHVFASSCSPVIYRGDNYPAEFQGNAFVCDPSANLVKRNLVFDGNLTLSSRFAYEDSEFLAATDERFRPVSLLNGPDGALWLVDMYRGIIQHGMFMTDYLRRETLDRGLDKGVHLGRIYRIVSDTKRPAPFLKLSGESSAELVRRLAHPNGWIRDTAQQLLVERRDPSVVPQLVELVSESPSATGRIHALWTLEGLFLDLPEPLRRAEALARAANGASPAAQPTVRLVEVAADLVFDAAQLTEEVVDACLDAIADPDPHVQIAAIRVAESLTRSSVDEALFLRRELGPIAREAPAEVVFQIALTAGNLPKPESLPLLADIATIDCEPLLFREAIISGLPQWETAFLKTLVARPDWNVERPGRRAVLKSLAAAVMRERHPANVGEVLQLAADERAAVRPWRREALLDGIAAAGTSRFARPVLFRAEPAALATLTASSDPAVMESVERIKRLLAWPGHQADAGAPRPRGRPLTGEETQSVSRGQRVFRQVCAGCHGLTGEGIRPLAAPLVDSDWVLGSDERLVRVLLHGLTGPVEVDGITYEPPIVLPAMPSVATLDDTAIADVLTYVRRAWGHEADPVGPGQVAAVRAATHGRTAPWTEPELKEFQ